MWLKKQRTDGDLKSQNKYEITSIMRCSCQKHRNYIIRGVGVMTYTDMDFCTDNNRPHVRVAIIIDDTVFQITAHSVNEAVGGFLIEYPDLCFNELEVNY